MKKRWYEQNLKEERALFFSKKDKMKASPDNNSRGFIEIFKIFKHFFQSLFYISRSLFFSN